MIYLLAIPLTALVSALHGWGKFRKGYSFPLLAMLFCALLYIDNVTHCYAGIIVAAGWRFLFRTGKIAKAENGAIQTGDKRLIVHEYWLPYCITLTSAYICGVLGYKILLMYFASTCIIMLFGAVIHQFLHDNLFYWRVFNPSKWYDIDGRKFLDARRLSEISGGLLISGVWCFFALLVFAKLIK